MADAQETGEGAKPSLPIITVFGATGSQGGAVLRSLVRTGKFSIRAVTRNPDGKKAKALASIPCVTTVKADLDDATSINEAVQGAYGVFLVTNYWAHFSEEQEKSQIKATIDACEASGIEHIVWSTLDNTKGVYEPIGSLTYVPHFQCKYDMDDQFPKESTTFLRCCFYYENFVGTMKPTKREGGGYTLCLPMGGQKVHMTHAEHIGDVAAEAFVKPDESKGKILIAVSDKLSGSEIVESLSEVSGEKIVLMEPDNATYATFFPKQGSEDLANMFQFYMEGKDYQSIRDEALAGSTGEFKYPCGLPFHAWLHDYTKHQKLNLE